MREVSDKDGPEAAGDKHKGQGGFLRWGIIAMAAIGALAVVYVILSASFKPKVDLQYLAKGEMADLVVTSSGKPAPATPFTDTSGRTITLKDFDGQVVVLNFWATWCAPCRVEMPHLAKLQAAYANKPVKVVAVSLDRAADEADARKFIVEHGPLAFYWNPSFALSRTLDPPVIGLPTTVIFDRNGKERARLSGGADWSSPEAKAVIDTVLQGG